MTPRQDWTPRIPGLRTFSAATWESCQTKPKPISVFSPAWRLSWRLLPRPSAAHTRIRFSWSARLRAWEEIGKHTSELQSPDHLVCRLLLEKKKNKENKRYHNSL